jgi:large subunit ribosomal protein L5
MNRLQEKYQKIIIPALQKEFNIGNVLAVPKIKKIVVNVGIGEIVSDKNAKEKAKAVLAAMTGQLPSNRQAKKAIAEFKIRQGDVVAFMVTLRARRMYQFLDKILTIVLPRERDFNGVKRNAFDSRGNYTLALKEQIIFPEVDYDKIDKVRGLEITVVINTKDQKQAFRLLELMGMPFEKKDK